METIKSLLDQVKKAKNVESDYGLAKALDLNKARISAYYAGKETPNEYICLLIAKATGRSYEEVSAIVRIEAEKDETRREAWREYYKSIGGVAASFVITSFVAVTFISTTPDNTHENQQVTTENVTPYTLCEVQFTTKSTNFIFLPRFQ